MRWKVVSLKRQRLSRVAVNMSEASFRGKNTAGKKIKLWHVINMGGIEEKSEVVQDSCACCGKGLL